MKIVKYIGGLGNQMFTFAFSLALEKRYKERIYSDLLYYGNHKFHNGFELQDVFDVKLHTVKACDLWKLTWYIPNYYIDYKLRQFIPSGPHSYKEAATGAYDEKVFSFGSKSMYYFGFWQDHRYFDAFKDDVANALTFKNPLAGKNAETATTISNSEVSVGIHIRRGDYVNHPKYKDICTLDYYKKAITKIKEHIDNPVYFIFSNDMEWCKENIAPMLDSSQIIFVDWNKGKQSYIDMQLMSLCKGLIIANSSFSWWGAYLNKRKPVVIAPRKWINNEWTFTFALKDWITI